MSITTIPLELIPDFFSHCFWKGAEQTMWNFFLGGILEFEEMKYEWVDANVLKRYVR